MINYRNYSDKELIETVYKSNDESKSIAFSELYNRYSYNIFHYCRKIFGEGNFAKDVFQDSFLNLLKSIESGIQISNVKGFLLKTARNLSLNHRRNEKVQLIEFEDFHSIFNENDLENKELELMIETALELLPEEHKEAFILQVFEELSYQEISELIEVPISTVRNRVVRAKSKLREI